MLPSAIGIDAKAPKQRSRKRPRSSSAFVLSPAGQHVMQTGDPTGDSLYYPVLNGVTPLPALPSLAAVHAQIDQPLHVGPDGDHDQRLVRPEHRPVIASSRPDDSPSAPAGQPGARTAAPEPGRLADSAGGPAGLPAQLALPVFWLMLACSSSPRAPASSCWRSRPGCSTRGPSGSPSPTCAVFTGGTATRCSTRSG